MTSLSSAWTDAPPVLLDIHTVLPCNWMAVPRFLVSPTHRHGPVTRKTGSSLSYTRLIRENRTYRFVWLSQVVSNAGDWFNTIAVLGLTLALTGSGLALGIVTICQMLPPFLMTPLAGVVAERYDRKRVMIIADILRAVVALGFLLVETADDVWMLYLFMAVLSGLGPFFDVTRTASLPSIARERRCLRPTRCPARPGPPCWPSDPPSEDWWPTTWAVPPPFR